MSLSRWCDQCRGEYCAPEYFQTIDGKSFNTPDCFTGHECPPKTAAAERRFAVEDS